ncbi:hypothetical protein HPB47_001095 [Ixodes persulcatus]|uniref:Uncharacterized protein n=1 Tax=Ixodes persulcatus TaxID=34615 RepID=A0AC60PQ25_IXOPE|nr:hypothetical protein HPB47_001095 [Ixodes persulcatus]
MTPGPIDAPFTVQELRSALKKCRKKALAARMGYHTSLHQIAGTSAGIRTRHMGIRRPGPLGNAKNEHFQPPTEPWFPRCSIPAASCNQRRKSGPLGSSRDIMWQRLPRQADLVVIEKALNAAAELQPQQIVILSDSKCALQRLANSSFSDRLNTVVRNTAAELEKQGTAVYLQWIPGHVGVKGNEKADCLATDPHQETASVTIPMDPRKVIQDVQWHVQSETPEPALPRGTLVGFSRAASTLVRRLRTNTAYTNEFLHRIGKTPYPICPSCDEVETVEHILSVCTEYATNRAGMLQRLSSWPGVSPQDALLPDGTRIICRRSFKVLLRFLTETGLRDRLQPPSSQHQKN